MFEIIEKNSKNEIIGNDMLKKATNKINNYHIITKNAILGISMILTEISEKPKEYLESSGFNTISEYAENMFGYKKSYTYKLIKISKFICIKDISGNDIPVKSLIDDKINTDYTFDVIKDVDGFEYSPSQMLELIPLTKEQIEENIKTLDSSLSCKDLRRVVKDIISPSIESNATVTDTEDNQSEEENNTEPKIQLTDKDRILKMLEICSEMENTEIKEKIINVFQKSLKVLEK